MDDAALLHEVLVATRRAFVPLPDTRVVERPGWMQLVTPSLRGGGMNEVRLAALAPADVDAVIDATLAEYRALGIRFRWTVGPDSSPPDLADRIAARGLVAERSLGLARALAGLAVPPAPGVTVAPVDAQNVEVFSEVMGRGWGMDPGPLLALNRHVLAAGGGRAPMYLACLDGQPAAAAASFLLPRSAYLMGAVVLPEHRGRGLYRALISARAQAAARQGLTIVTTLAREATSAPILRRLGFAVVCRLTVLVDRPAG
ncbi:MAG: GNAT family N-acetyltransferase [Nannocystaceae bacterium]